ncbi:MFS general substrate transporter [Thozetella sp. PMI_491]|nr:MFS general substrate transporter [Thozetella sp. PMI_491]
MATTPPNETEQNPESEKVEGPVTPPTEAAADEPPNGGMVAWLVVFGAWCTSFCSFGWLNSIGVFQAYYMSGPLREYSASTIAWIPSLQVFFMMAMGPVVGKLFDTYGPRWLIIGGTFLHVFGLMMASISTQYYQFLLSQGVCSAIGVAAVFQPAIGCIMGWFSNERRGIAYGLLSTGSSLGGVIFPVMLNRLVNTVGYGWAMRISAFLILFLLILAILTVRMRNLPKKKGAPGAPPSKPFKEPGYLMLLIGMFLLTFGIYVPVNYLPSEAIAFGMSQDLAQYLVAIFNAASLFGRLSAGFLSDRLGKYNTFCASCYIAGIIVLALWIPGTSQEATIAFAVLFGFFSGAYVSLIGALVAQISPLPEIGIRTGLLFFMCAAPGLVTSPIAGALLANSGNWADLKVFAGVFILVGTTVIFGCRISHVGLKPGAIF